MHSVQWSKSAYFRVISMGNAALAKSLLGLLACVAQLALLVCVMNSQVLLLLVLLLLCCCLCSHSAWQGLYFTYQPEAVASGRRAVDTLLAAYSKIRFYYFCPVLLLFVVLVRIERSERVQKKGLSTTHEVNITSRLVIVVAHGPSTGERQT